MKYRAFKQEVASRGSTVVNEIIRHRLNWVKDDIPDLKPTSEKLFGNADDVFIITNDFPYNFEPSITHLVVWSKNIIESDPESEIGDVDDHTRKIIDRYVEKTFVEQLGLSPKNVVWFRNFPAIQSVRELSHIHVLIKDMKKEEFDQVYRTPGVVLSDKDIQELE